MQQIKNACRTRQSHNTHKSHDLLRIVARHQTSAIVASVGLLAMALPMMVGISDMTSTMVVGYGGILIGTAVTGAFKRD